MGLDIVTASRAATQPSVGVTLEEAHQEGLRDRCDVAWVGQVAPSDALEELSTVLSVVRRQASQHLVAQGADGVPVDTSAVALLVNDFWSQVLGCSAHGLGRDVVHDAFLAQTEVGNLDVAISIQEHVFRLQISVDDSQAVQVGDRAGGLGDVEASTALAEAARSAEMVEQLTAWAELHDHVELLGGLEGVVEGDDEGVGDGFQDTSLGLRVLHLVSFDDVLLAQHLHRVDFASAHMLHKHHLSIGPLAQDLHELEIVQDWCGGHLQTPSFSENLGVSQGRQNVDGKSV
mmetsp:Transcript_51914/g.110318  ORF Transcript_51914/g.110318 Transcript_51914/m.110318 type:complete len:289 (-) Transcript_51914:16-882(-)